MSEPANPDTASPSLGMDPGPRPTMDPRETMRRLPRWLQHPLTVFTGKALPAQQPLSWWSPTYHLAAAVCTAVFGVVVGLIGYLAGGAAIALMLPGWAMTLHGLRNLRMLIFHQCAHANMYRKPFLDELIGETLASLLVVQNFQRYRREHVSEHHAAHHMTLRDPTVQAFLLTLGLSPGMSRIAMWRRVLRKVSSPLFHAQFAIARVRSFFHASSSREKALAIAIHGGILTISIFSGNLPAIILCLYVPLFPLFQISNTLRLCVKHTFPAPGIDIRRGRAYFSSLTSAVFLGEAVPAGEGSVPVRVFQWGRWVARMALIHAPIRYLVITADTPVHDWHHRYPAARNWEYHIYARQIDDDAGRRGWPPYTEFWGLATAINEVFDSLSAADPDEFDARKVHSVSRRELFAAFDD